MHLFVYTIFRLIFNWNIIFKNEYHPSVEIVITATEQTRLHVLPTSGFV